MSTARHQLAGAPGTGTTIDNMASRLKCWCNWHGNFNSVPTIRESMNLSSIGDAGVGLYNMNFTAVLATGSPSVIPNFSRVASWASGGADVPIFGTVNVRVSVVENGVNLDPNAACVLIAGNLA